MDEIPLPAVVVLLSSAFVGCGGATSPTKWFGDCAGRDVFNSSTVADLSLVFPSDASRDQIGNAVDLLMEVRSEGGTTNPLQSIDSIDVDYARLAVFIDFKCGVDRRGQEQVVRLLEDLDPTVDIKRSLAPEDLD